MKTSLAQYDLMIGFMEQHGDLSKPSNKAKGRLTNIILWNDLVSSLNSEGSGESKTLEKWKKVWSDFKNNTKKKAARIHNAARGTGGGPALHAKLSDLEQRLMALIGPVAATGLCVEEAGLGKIVTPPPQAQSPPRVRTPITSPPRVSSPALAPTTADLQTAITTSPSRVIVEMLDWTLPGPSTRPHILVPDTQPGPSTSPPARPHILVPETEDVDVQDSRIIDACATPYRGLSPYFDRNSAPPPRRLTPRPRRRRAAASPQRPRQRLRTTNTDQAAQDFLQSDAAWRAFKRTQHEESMARQRESERIRHLELETQRGWQAICNRALDLLQQFINK